MRATDFIYDGTQLSSLGYVIGRISDAGTLDVVNTDSQRSFSNFSLFEGKWRPLAVSTYKDVLKIEMSIIKNPCDASFQDDMKIPLSEIRMIKRWLGRPTFHELRIVDDEYDGIFWMGSCNVEEVHSGGICVGFNLTFTTDRPFALADKLVFRGRVSAGDEVAILDESDEIGFIYPDVEIQVVEPGDFTITNGFDGRQTIIRNCSGGEKITMSKVLTIETTDGAHAIGDDFNWKFLRINNNYDSRVNILTFSGECTYKISYNPIVKAVIA